MKPLLFAMLLLLWFSAFATEHSKPPVRIILNDWSSQLVISYITAEILNKAGFPVELVHFSTRQQWSMLKRDRADVQMEVWEGTMADKFELLLNDGYIVDLGEHQAKTREEWWYPIHVEELCPGLPDWRALLKCWPKFISPDTEPYGRYVGGPWEKPDAARIRALKLHFRVVRVSADELWEELEVAYQQKSALVMFNWTPNWAVVAYKGKFVEFPAWSKACETEPEWGINFLFPYDCGNPKDGWLKKIANRKLVSRYPCAISLLKRITFNSMQISTLSAWVVVEGRTEQNAAKKWLEMNKPVWQEWLNAGCRDESGK